MKEIVDGFLALDLSDLLALFDQVIKNPGSNPQASLLVLGGVVVLTLLAVVIAILVITSRDDDDDDGTIEAGLQPETIVERTVMVERPPREPLTPEERRWLATRSFLLGALGLSLIWLLTGITTGSEAMCLSCHGSDMPHSERLVEEGSDPHASTSCVRCHGSGGVFGSLTYDVPGRAIHFAEGIIAPKTASGFGKPIASSACSSCHRRMGDGIVTVERRGVRVKHKEPLDAGATCVGCHEMQRLTGAVGSWTVGMSACLRCHDNVQASSECSDCHVKDVAQALHVNREPSPRRLVPETKCYTCHDERACDSCHG
ncbi:MAG: hypothetical protein IBX62_07325, partial [Coriobacteriia bacterium]|nr:hypothetical protein [Coriobacteriia bacterium]